MLGSFATLRMTESFLKVSNITYKRDIFLIIHPLGPHDCQETIKSFGVRPVRYHHGIWSCFFDGIFRANEYPFFFIFHKLLHILTEQIDQLSELPDAGDILKFRLIKDLGESPIRYYVIVNAN